MAMPFRTGYLFGTRTCVVTRGSRNFPDKSVDSRIHYPMGAKTWAKTPLKPDLQP